MNGSPVPDTECCSTFEWTLADGPSFALISAISELQDEESLQLEPLYHALDPDSLDSLFGQSPFHRSQSNGTVQFEYAGYHVVINANGRGYIHEQAESTSQPIAVENPVDADDD